MTGDDLRDGSPLLDRDPFEVEREIRSSSSMEERVEGVAGTA